MRCFTEAISLLRRDWEFTKTATFAAGDITLVVMVELLENSARAVYRMVPENSASPASWAQNLIIATSTV